VAEQFSDKLITMCMEKLEAKLAYGDAGGDDGGGRHLSAVKTARSPSVVREVDVGGGHGEEEGQEMDGGRKRESAREARMKEQMGVAGDVIKLLNLVLDVLRVSSTLQVRCSISAKES